MGPKVLTLIIFEVTAHRSFVIYQLNDFHNFFFHSFLFRYDFQVNYECRTLASDIWSISMNGMVVISKMGANYGETVCTSCVYVCMCVFATYWNAENSISSWWHLPYGCLFYDFTILIHIDHLLRAPKTFNAQNHILCTSIMFEKGYR